MLFRNKNFEEDIKELTSFSDILFKASKKNVIRVNSEDEVYADDYDLLLNVWNNTVPTFNIDRDNVKGVMFSSRLNTGVIIMKEYDFVYGSAIPCAIYSLSNGLLFASPEGNSIADFSRIVKIIVRLCDLIVRKDLIKSSYGIKDTIVSLLSIFVIKNSIRDSKHFSKSISYTTLVEKVIKTNDNIKPFSDIIIQISKEYKEKENPIDDIINKLIYENGIVKYINSFDELNDTEDSSIFLADDTTDILKYIHT